MRSAPQSLDISRESAVVHSGRDVGQIIIEKVGIGVQRHRSGLVAEHALHGFHVCA